MFVEFLKFLVGFDVFLSRLLTDDIRMRLKDSWRFRGYMCPASGSLK